MMTRIANATNSTEEHDEIEFIEYSQRERLFGEVNTARLVLERFIEQSQRAPASQLGS